MSHTCTRRRLSWPSVAAALCCCSQGQTERFPRCCRMLSLLEVFLAASLRCIRQRPAGVQVCTNLHRVLQQNFAAPTQLRQLIAPDALLVCSCMRCMPIFCAVSFKVYQLCYAGKQHCACTSSCAGEMLQAQLKRKRHTWLHSRSCASSSALFWLSLPRYCWKLWNWYTNSSTMHHSQPLGSCSTGRTVVSAVGADSRQAGRQMSACGGLLSARVLAAADQCSAGKIQSDWLASWLKACTTQLLTGHHG